MKQKVLCIKADILFEKGKWDGLKTDELDNYYKLLLEKSEFQERGPLETNPEYKQIIPQVVLRHNGKYFLHRQANRDETRLNSLCPLPLGGHVEEFDVQDGKDLLQVALEREIHEEADIKSNITGGEFIGLIYIEDENPVNHVHVGLAYIYDLDGDDVQIIEEGLENIGFVDLNYLVEHKNELTYWSRIIVDHLSN